MDGIEARAKVARERMRLRLCEMGVTTSTVEAMWRLPRHRFVPRFWSLSSGVPGKALAPVEYRVDTNTAEALDILYDIDRAVAVTQPSNPGAQPTSTASSLRLLAAQADHLALMPGMSVLEIGTGPAFFAALLAELVGPTGQVVTVDIDQEMVSGAAATLVGCGYANVTVLCGDGHVGVPGRGQFDRVVASVGCVDVAGAWLDQLADEGRALVPLLHGAVHPIVDIGSDRQGRFVMCSGYVAIQGLQADTQLWPHALAAVEPTASEPLPANVRATLAAQLPRDSLFLRREWDLGVWVAIADQHAGNLASLNDGTGSSARIDARQGRLQWAGPAGPELARSLRTHVEDWMEAGAPSLEQYEHEFVPRTPRTGPPPGRGGRVIPRTDHHQIVTLTTQN